MSRKINRWHKPASDASLSLSRGATPGFHSITVDVGLSDVFVGINWSGTALRLNCPRVLRCQRRLMGEPFPLRGE